MGLFDEIKSSNFSDINQLLRPKPKKNLIKSRQVLPPEKPSQSQAEALPSLDIKKSDLIAKEPSITTNAAHSKDTPQQLETKEKITQQDVSRNVSQNSVKTAIATNTQNNRIESSLLNTIGENTQNKECVKSAIDDNTQYKLCVKLAVDNCAQYILSLTLCADLTIDNNAHDYACSVPLIFSVTEFIGPNDLSNDIELNSGIYSLNKSVLILSYFNSLRFFSEIYILLLVNNFNALKTVFPNLSKAQADVDKIKLETIEIVKREVCVDIAIDKNIHNINRVKSTIANNTHLDNCANSSIDKSTQLYNVTKGVDSAIANYTQLTLSSNYTKVPKSIFNLLKVISKTDFHVYLYLIRLSYGFHTSETNIPINKFLIEKKLGINRRTVTKSLQALIQNNLIEFFDHKRRQALVKVFYPTSGGLSSTKNYSYFTLDNNIFELPLKSKDLVTYTILFYFSYGMGNNCTHQLLTSELSKLAQVHTRNFQTSLRSLISSGYIKRLTIETNNKGISYRVSLPHELNSELNETKLEDECVNSSIGDSTQSVFSAIDRFAINLERVAIAENTQNIISYNKTTTYTQPTKSAIATNSTIKDIINIKTSSGDADDFFIFLKSKFSENEFTLSKQVAAEILNQFGFENAKMNIERLYSRIKEAKSPVGLWRDSLINPEKYPELSQKSQHEIIQEQREKEAEERRVEHRRKQQEQEKIKHINTAWNAVDEMKQNEFIAQSENYFRDIMDGKVPPSAVIIERAKKMNFENGND